VEKFNVGGWEEDFACPETGEVSECGQNRRLMTIVTASLAELREWCTHVFD
jgi:hypothetical protein